MEFPSETARLKLARHEAEQTTLAGQLAWKALVAENKGGGLLKDPKAGAGALQPHRRPFQRAGAVSARIFGSAPAPAHVPLACVLPPPPQAVEPAPHEVALRLPLRPKVSTAARDFAIVLSLDAIVAACSAPARGR